MSEIFGRGLAESLAPFSAEEGECTLKALLGKPGQSRPTRKEMIFFVNRRPVDSKTISYALMEGFHTHIPKGRFPPAILFLEIDPASVDVNIHPAKREVRFREDPKVRSFLIHAVLQHNQSFKGGEVVATEPVKVFDKKAGKMVPEIDPRALEVYGLKETQLEQHPKPAPKESIKPEKKMSSSSDSRPAQENARELLKSNSVGARSDPTASWRLIDRAHGDLVLFSAPQGVVALHLRAAYERIRLEQLEDTLRDSSASSSQTLLLSEPLELDGVDRKNLESNLERLLKLGFVMEEFGRNFYRLEGCPTWIEPGLASGFIRDFLDLARDNRQEAKFEALVREALQTQANFQHEQKDDFSDEDIILLTNQLLACRNPYVCPKGRPTYYEIPKRDFENRFRRKL